MLHLKMVSESYLNSLNIWRKEVGYNAHHHFSIIFWGSSTKKAEENPHIVNVKDKMCGSAIYNLERYRAGIMGRRVESFALLCFGYKARIKGRREMFQ